MKIIVSLFLVTAGLERCDAGPCDVYHQGGVDCVAAHSMTRALYSSYDGPLYRVTRTSDLAVVDVGVLKDGFADVSIQDELCAESQCVVTLIYDQSPYGNHLYTAPGGGAAPEPDAGVTANARPTLVSGHQVYGAYFDGGKGYRNDNTSAIAVDDEEETMYMVVDGRHYNEGCCFDYGNAEVDALDHGPGTMEALYWGNSSGWGHGSGAGPWVMADLEDGLWAGSEPAWEQEPIDADYVTAMLKGGSGVWSLKGGDAQAGELQTLYEGVRPDGYDPMKKQGAIILGIGGDNSDWAIGTWFEGAMVAGYASPETDAAVMADIAAAGYGRGRRA